MNQNLFFSNKFNVKYKLLLSIINMFKKKNNIKNNHLFIYYFNEI